MAAWAPPGTKCSPDLVWQVPGPQGTELLVPFLIILVVQNIEECILGSGPRPLDWQSRSAHRGTMSNYRLTSLAVWLMSVSLRNSVSTGPGLSVLYHSLGAQHRAWHEAGAPELFVDGEVKTPLKLGGSSHVNSGSPS